MKSLGLCYFISTFILLSLDGCLFQELDYESVNDNRPREHSIWDSIWKVSCDYVRNHVETSTHRVRRSVDTWNSIDFDNPEQLFNYLYPLADVQMKDLKEVIVDDDNSESGRSHNQRNNFPLHSTVSVLLSDFLEYWQVECELRENSETQNNETESDELEDSNIDTVDESEEGDVEYIEAEDDLDLKNTKGENQSTITRNSDIHNRQSRSQDQSSAYSFQTSTIHSYFTPADQRHVSQVPNRTFLNTSMPVTSYKYSPTNVNGINVNNYGNHTGKRRRVRRKKKKQNPGSISKMDSYGQSTTESSSTSTTAASTKGSAEGDTFFSAYGGDIEYFFPLISFGIPFDGEITLLGFHGFKGIFPYRR